MNLLSLLDLCGKSPDLQNPLDGISLTVGKLFRLKLNSNYFYDAEDGNTGQLSVTMTMGNGNPIQSDHWVQFDPYNQVIYGLALNESEKMDEVLLVIAEDACGQSTYDAVRVDVTSKVEFKNPSVGYIVEFSDIPVCPIENLMNLYVFIKDLTVWFNDSREILIMDKRNCTLHLLMATKKENSFHEENYAEHGNVFDEKGEILVEFLCFFMPSFKIIKFESFLQNFSVGEEDNVSHFVPFKSDISLWLEIVLPVIIILTIFVLVIVTLYICCTRKKKQYILQSDKPTFLEERRPVIFQTEVPIEDPTLNPRTPVILSHYDEVPSSEVELLDQRSLPSTPDYTPPTTQPPPAYRIPPPYSGSHQYW
jgi:neurexin